MKFLAVDDNATNLEILRVLLRSCGVPVLAASSGEAAVELAQQERPNLIFMDLSMPGEIDGLEATRRIKASPETRDIVVIAITAMVAAGDEAQALAAGCSAFIRKPYTRKQLLSVLERHFPQLTTVVRPLRTGSPIH
jgi:CheY-like chemotaxis protein